MQRYDHNTSMVATMNIDTRDIKVCHVLLGSLRPASDSPALAGLTGAAEMSSALPEG